MNIQRTQRKMSQIPGWLVCVVVSPISIWNPLSALVFDGVVVVTIGSIIGPQIRISMRPSIA